MEHEDEDDLFTESQVELCEKIAAAEGEGDDPDDIIIDAIILLTFEYELAGSPIPEPETVTDTVTVEVRGILEDRLYRPQAYQARIDRTRPIADRYRDD